MGERAKKLAERIEARMWVDRHKECVHMRREMAQEAVDLLRADDTHTVQCIHCRQPVSIYAAYRCTDCDRYLHKNCASVHFRLSTTEARAERDALNELEEGIRDAEPSAPTQEEGEAEDTWDMMDMWDASVDQGGGDP